MPKSFFDFFPEAQLEGSTLVALQPGGCGGGQPKSPSDRPGSACLKRPGGSSGIQKSPRTPKTQEKPAKASKSTYKNCRGRKKPKKSRIKPAKHRQKSPRTQKTQEKPDKTSKNTDKNPRGRKKPKKSRIKPAKASKSQQKHR